MTGVMTSNCKATNASTESSETVPNSEDDSHQATDMDVDLEEFSVDPSNNVDKGSLDDSGIVDDFGNVTSANGNEGPHGSNVDNNDDNDNEGEGEEGEGEEEEIPQPRRCNKSAFTSASAMQMKKLARIWVLYAM
ncbi:hypothetical protein L208DRAFT_1481265 [Tricholoma matsutake]|nr:hypothetical protein L208DRAFT_1481265 [Tricholoma matsutake 945]